MQIKCDNMHSPSMNGKFYMKSGLSFSNKAFIERFLDYKEGGKCVRDIIKAKPYDVFASQNNRENISIKSNYKKYLYDGEKLQTADVKVWHTILDKDVDMETNYKRLLSGFESFKFCKHLSNGYNTKLGKIKSAIVTWVETKILSKVDDFI